MKCIFRTDVTELLKFFFSSLSLKQINEIHSLVFMLTMLLIYRYIEECITFQYLRFFLFFFYIFRRKHVREYELMDQVIASKKPSTPNRNSEAPFCCFYFRKLLGFFLIAFIFLLTFTFPLTAPPHPPLIHQLFFFLHFSPRPTTGNVFI